MLTRRGVWRLGVGPCSPSTYCLAQLDDYSGMGRSQFPWRPPVAFSLQARVVSPGAAFGTWGFGFWNEPFGLGCSPGGLGTRLPAPPQAAWFFSASSRSYLSLRDDMPPNGFFAQVVRSEQKGLWLTQAGIRLLYRPTDARRLLARRIVDRAVPVANDPREWHRYQIRWTAASLEFSVDGDVLTACPVVPREPLGAVIWIDNQYAAFDPHGRIAWGTEFVDAEAWLEVQDFSCTSLIPPIEEPVDLERRPEARDEGC